MSARRLSRLGTRGRRRGGPGRGGRRGGSVPRPPPRPPPPLASAARRGGRRGRAPAPRPAPRATGRRAGEPRAERTRAPAPVRGAAPTGGRRGSGRRAGGRGARRAPSPPHPLDLRAPPLELGVVGEALEQVLPDGHRIPRPAVLHEGNPLVEEGLLVVGGHLQGPLEFRQALPGLPRVDPTLPHVPEPAGLG